MNSALTQAVSRYFNSWWIPSTLCLVLLISLFIPAILNWGGSWPGLSVLCDIHVGITLVGIGGVPCAAVWNLFRKRWANGILNAILFMACGLVALVGVFAVMMCIRTGQ